MYRLQLNNWTMLMLLPVFMLGGCSLDSSDSDSTAHISGVVNKGIVIAARVDAYAITNGIIIDEVSLAHDITDATGKYSMSVNLYNGPLAIVMSPVGDGSSKVKCDVPDNDDGTAGCSLDGVDYIFGALMPMAYSMEALIPNVTGSANITASVTPMTHMAAAYAKEIGLGEAGIKSANEKVAKLLDIDDILNVEPVDITDDVQLASSATSLAAIKYGYLSASIAAIANEENNGDVGATLAILAASYAFENGQLANNESTDDRTKISLEEITEGAKAILAKETDVSGGTFGLAQSQIENLNVAAANAVPDSVTDTVVVVDISPSDIQKAKDMVTELRTWGQKITTDLSTGSEAFGSKLDAIDSLSADDLESVLTGTGLGAVAMARAYINEHSGELSGGNYDFAVLLAEILTAEEISELGAISGSVIVNGLKVTLNNGNVDGSTVNMSATMPADSGTTFTLALDPSTVTNAGAEVDIAASFATVTFAESVSDFLAKATDETDTLMLPTPTAVSLDLEVSLGQKATATVVDPVTFTGKLKGSMLVKELSNRVDELTENVNPESIVMEGEFSTLSGESFSAKFDAKMTNASTFVAVDQLPLGTVKANFGSYTFSEDENSLEFVFPGEIITFVFDPAGGNVTATAIESDYVWTHNFGTYDSLDAFITQHPWLNGSCIECLTTDVKGEGEHEVIMPTTWASSGTVDGELVEQSDDDENADMWRDIDGSLTVSADYEGYPQAQITLNADRTAYEGFTASFNISYDGVSIVAQGSINVTEDEDELDLDASIILTTSNGDKLEVYPNIVDQSLRGTIRVNGNVIGVIKPSPLDDDILIVTFVNGDIETVNL